jgi:WD40 repeat protein
MLGVNACAQVSKDLIVTGGNDCLLKFWDWKKGILVKKIAGHGHAVKCLCIIRKGFFLASGSQSQNMKCSIKIWRIKDGAMV